MKSTVYKIQYRVPATPEGEWEPGAYEYETYDVGFRALRTYAHCEMSRVQLLRVTTAESGMMVTTVLHDWRQGDNPPEMNNQEPNRVA